MSDFDDADRSIPALPWLMGGPGTPPTMLCTTRRPSRARSGISLLELTIVLAVLSVAVSMHASTLVSLGRQRDLARESAAVSAAVQNVIETIRGHPFEEVAWLFDSDPANDPQGPGTAPGNRFAVEGLDPLEGAADGMVGTILLPERRLDDGSWQVREDLARPELGLPRDLNGDSIVDALDHRADLIRLPLRVRVDWRSRHGPRSYAVTTMLAQVRR